MHFMCNRGLVSPFYTYKMSVQTLHPELTRGCYYSIILISKIKYITDGRNSMK